MYKKKPPIFRVARRVLREKTLNLIVLKLILTILRVFFFTNVMFSERRIIF
jgi:hypothetical protein